MTVEIRTDQLQLDVLYTMLRDAYWSKSRSVETIQKSLEHSLNFAAYTDNRMIGFARVITDYATFAYLCDVIVLESYRGQGVGKALMRAVLAHADLCDIRRFTLVTRDAHELYKPFGFTALPMPEKYMERFDPKA
jgi:predicted N-acetyltransferase YhbS